MSWIVFAYNLQYHPQRVLLYRFILSCIRVAEAACMTRPCTNKPIVSKFMNDSLHLIHGNQHRLRCLRHSLYLVPKRPLIHARNLTFSLVCNMPNPLLKVLQSEPSTPMAFHVPCSVLKCNYMNIAGQLPSLLDLK